MRNAYLIMAHHNFDQLGLLLQLLDHEDNDIYVHIDLKAGNVDLDSLHACVNKSGLYFIPRMSITWGGDSIIWCEMELLKSALSSRHDYYHLLSGEDLPIKTNEQIAHFLESNPKMNYVGVSQRGEESRLPDSLTKRFRYLWPLQNKVGRKRSLTTKAFLFIQKLCGVDRTRCFDGEFAKGPQWFSITEDFARYVVEREAWVRKVFSDTICCDEVFLQTLYVNSSFGRNAMPQLDDNAMAMRLVDWTRSDGQSPYILRMLDYSLIECSSCLFARKFDISVDADIVSKVAADLLNVTSV